MHRVAITANRKLTDADYPTIFNKMAELVTDPEVEAIYIGGAVGGDTVALESALSIACMNRPRLIVVVPCRLENQPKSTHAASRQADELIELNNPITQSDGFNSYKIRNIYMVDNAARTVAFWSGDQKSGTYHAIHHTEKTGKPVDIVKIQGLDK